MTGGGGATAEGGTGVIGQAGAVGEAAVEVNRSVEMVVEGVVRVTAGAGDGGDPEGPGGVHVGAVAPRRPFAGIRVSAAVTEVTANSVGIPPGGRVAQTARVMAGRVGTGVGSVDPGRHDHCRLILSGGAAVSEDDAVVVGETPENMIGYVSTLYINIRMRTAISSIICMTIDADLAGVKVLAVGLTQGFDNIPA